MQDENSQPLTLGTGFFIRDSVIATNWHVIAGASRGVAKPAAGGTEYQLQAILAADRAHDLALIRIDHSGQPLQLESVTPPEIGEAVYVVGNPEGLTGTFSAGVVSSIRHVNADTLIQITAPISPGSSGGPVLNSRGNVVGVATATFREGQNLNFAVPAGYLATMLRLKEAPLAFSTARRTKPATSYLSRFGQKNSNGVTGEAFQWSGAYDFESSFTFSLRNHLGSPIQNVYCLVVFYDSRGQPIEVDGIRYPDVIPPGLARRAQGLVDPSVKRLTTAKDNYVSYAFKPYTKVEFRILDFSIVQ